MKHIKDNADGTKLIAMSGAEWFACQVLTGLANDAAPGSPAAVVPDAPAERRAVDAGNGMVWGMVAPAEERKEGDEFRTRLNWHKSKVYGARDTSAVYRRRIPAQPGYEVAP